MPYLMTRFPPALVARLPPIVQLPRAPRSRGNIMPAASAASCTRCSTAPACTVIVPETVSTSLIALIRSRLSTTSPPNRLAPPARPVKPPCVTTACRLAWQNASARDTSCVDRGRINAMGSAPGVPLQSRTRRVPRSAPGVTTSAPNSATNRSTKLIVDDVMIGSVFKGRDGLFEAGTHHFDVACGHNEIETERASGERILRRAGVNAARKIVRAGGSQDARAVLFDHVRRDIASR